MNTWQIAVLRRYNPKDKTGSAGASLPALPVGSGASCRRACGNLGSERAKGATERRNRAAVHALRHREYHMSEAAAPLKRIEHLAPELSHHRWLISEDAAAPRAQDDARATGRVRRAQHKVHAAPKVGLVGSIPMRCRRQARTRALLGAAAVTTVTGVAAGSREENGGAR